MSATLYARSDLKEVLTVRGTTYKTKNKGGVNVIECDPADVKELLATGSVVERAHDVPQTFDEIQEAERLEHDGNLALQAAARTLAAGAADTVRERGARRGR